MHAPKNPGDAACVPVDDGGGAGGPQPRPFIVGFFGARTPPLARAHRCHRAHAFFGQRPMRTRTPDFRGSAATLCERATLYLLHNASPSVDFLVLTRPSRVLRALASSMDDAAMAKLEKLAA